MACYAAAQPQFLAGYPYALGTPLTYTYTPQVPIPVYCTVPLYPDYTPYLHLHTPGTYTCIVYTIPLCPGYTTHLHLHTPGTYTSILYPYALGTPLTYTSTPQVPIPLYPG